MPTSREFFESELPGTFLIENELTLGGPAGPLPVKVPLKHYVDFESRSRHIAVYLPAEIPATAFLRSVPLMMESLLKVSTGNVRISSGRGVGAVAQQLKVENRADGILGMNFSADGLTEIAVNELPFTGRLFVYSANEITPQEREAVATPLAGAGIFPWYRGPAFAASQTAHMHPLAFVSHDSRDKDDIVRPLVLKLQSMMLPVWYDEYSLTVGSSLRNSIESGLKTCSKCILVLTPNFLAKGGWAKREYDTVFTRELVEDQDVILPIWAGVDRNAVYAYSPILADKVGLQWSSGIDEVSKALFRVLASIGGAPYARLPQGYAPRRVPAPR